MKGAPARRFEGRSVLVTGAASGIGRAAAEAFAREGACLTLVDQHMEQLQPLVAVLGEHVLAVEADVADGPACDAAVAAAVARWGRLDVAFNNAGIGSPPAPSFGDQAADIFERIMAVNVRGVFNCIQAEARAMLATRSGAIVNTASVAATIAAPGMAAYVASKHGVAGLTKAAAIDLIASGIRVNAVCPGLTDTPQLGKLDAATAQAMAAGVPIGRMAHADEIARAVLFLASDESSYCVGTLLMVDGGVSLI